MAESEAKTARTTDVLDLGDVRIERIREGMPGLEVIVEDADSGRRCCYRIDLGSGDAEPCG